MTNVGKWLAYIVFAFLMVFLIIIFLKPEFLQSFTTWTLGIIGLITAGTVVYIIFKKK